MAQRSYGLAKLVEAALSRPAHNPNPRLHHVADEYAAKGGLHKPVSCECGRCIAGELRRGLRHG